MMKNTLKTYTRYSAAHKAANGNPIIRIGNLFITGCTLNHPYVEISLIDTRNGLITGNVTLKHLDRLGNANWAESGRPRGQAPHQRIWPDAPKSTGGSDETAPSSR